MKDTLRSLLSRVTQAGAALVPPLPEPLHFHPPLLRIQESPPHPLGRWVLKLLLGLLAALLLWSIIGQLDIVAVAEGKLIPQTYLKIVQPADSGIVKEILTHEGDSVRQGQILMRMDMQISEADTRSIEADYQRKRLALRRIDAELGGKSFQRESQDPLPVFNEIEAQYRANRASLESALASERTQLEKARQDMAAAQQVQIKLKEVLPHYIEQDKAFEDLTRRGFAGSLMASDKHRERVEKEQELHTQAHVIESAKASIAQSEKKLVQISSDYRRQLYTERNDIQSQLEKLTQERVKQAHKQELMELKAPQDGVVKDLATHTPGTVTQPGTVLLTLVPKDETLRAEVWVSNEDIGFVRPGQKVRLKFAAYPFQQYGMANGMVEYVGADATDKTASDGGNGSTGLDAANRSSPKPAAALSYRALIALDASALDADGDRFPLSVGMQANAEILLGKRSVLEYLLSPVRKAWHEAARER